MPTYDTSDRYALRALSPGSQPGSGIDDGFVALRNDVSAKLTPFDQGARESRPPSTAGTPGIAGRTYRSTGDGGIDRDYGTGWTTERPGLFAALPGTPDEGMLISFQTAAMKTAGVGPWLLRYDSTIAGSYRWAVVSARPITATIVTSESRNNGAYGDLATVGPTVQTPLAGDYAVSHEAQIATSSVVSGYGAQSFAVGAAAALSADEATVGGNGATGSVGRQAIVKTAVASGVNITAKYAATGGGGSAFANRAISITPLRVG